MSASPVAATSIPKLACPCSKIHLVSQTGWQLTSRLTMFHCDEFEQWPGYGQGGMYGIFAPIGSIDAFADQMTLCAEIGATARKRLRIHAARRS